MTVSENLVHPGDTVKNLIESAGLTIVDAANCLRVSRQQLTRVIGRKSSISPEMALRLESVFGRSAEDWLRRQAAWDLDRARNEVRSKLAALTRFAPPDRRLGADHVVERLRKHQNELKAAGLKHLFLFGSVARNEAGADSDVDLYFEKNRDAVLGLIEIGKLQERIEEILGVKTDLVPFDGLRKSVKETAQLESVKIF